MRRIVVFVIFSAIVKGISMFGAGLLFELFPENWAGLSWFVSFPVAAFVDVRLLRHNFFRLQQSPWMKYFTMTFLSCVAGLWVVRLLFKLWRWLNDMGPYQGTYGHGSTWFLFLTFCAIAATITSFTLTRMDKKVNSASSGH